MSSFNKADSSEQLLCYYTGQEDCTPRKSWTSVRDHYLFHYVLSGQGCVEAPEGKRTLHAGEGFIFFPQERSLYTADLEDPWSYLWFAFSGRQALSSLEDCGLTRYKRYFRSRDHQKCQKELEEIKLYIETKKTYFSRVAGIYLFFETLREQADHLKNTSLNQMDSDELIRLCFEYIYRNHDKAEASVKAMAEYAGLSRKYFSAQVKCHSGKTPQEHLMDYRMLKAQEFLKNTDLSIAEICYNLGYEDQLIFSRAFKKWNGEAPSKYRQKNSSK